jgi:hypothetical protein
MFAHRSDRLFRRNFKSLKNNGKDRLFLEWWKR